MIFEHLVVGLLAVGMGVAALRYNYQLVGFTGHIGAVERYMGYGSTYLFMKLLAVLVCIGGFLYAFGLLTPIMGWLLSPLAAFFHPLGGQ